MSSSLISFSDPSSQTDLLLRMVEQMVGFIDEEIAAGNWVTEQAVIMWYMEQVEAELQTEAEANTRQALAQSMIEQMIHEKTVVVKEESPDPAVPELRKLERPGRRSNEQDDENLRACFKKCRDLMLKEMTKENAWSRFERDEKWQGERGEKLKKLIKQAWEGTVGALEVLEAKIEKPADDLIYLEDWLRDNYPLQPEEHVPPYKREEIDDPDGGKRWVVVTPGKGQPRPS